MGIKTRLWELQIRFSQEELDCTYDNVLYGKTIKEALEVISLGLEEKMIDLEKAEVSGITISMLKEIREEEGRNSDPSKISTRPKFLGGE